jgi:hypothetical protein
MDRPKRDRGKIGHRESEFLQMGLYAVLTAFLYQAELTSSSAGSHGPWRNPTPDDGRWRIRNLRERGRVESQIGWRRPDGRTVRPRRAPNCARTVSPPPIWRYATPCAVLRISRARRRTGPPRRTVPSPENATRGEGASCLVIPSKRPRWSAPIAGRALPCGNTDCHPTNRRQGRTRNGSRQARDASGLETVWGYE